MVGGSSYRESKLVVSMKKFVGMTTEGKIRSDCLHEKPKQTFNGASVIYKCGGCENVVYPVEIGNGFYYLTPSEIQTLKEPYSKSR